MAASKKKKVVKCKQPPQTGIAVEKDPNRFFGSSPSWKFSGADMDPGCSWSICKQHLQNAFWDEVLTRLRAFESMSYEEIFVQGKKHHHEIDVLQLNKVAIKRLEELQLELEALRSLKISATHRIYGYSVDQTFDILWYDDNHGDNSTCVCRSRKKHT